MSAESLLNGRVTLHAGDMLSVLPTLPENSVDAVCCDPPYHLTSIVKRFGGENAAAAKVGQTGAFARASRGFMSKTWDGGDTAFRPETWAHVLRVLKPGGYILAFSSSRTFGRMSVALEDAGFITHPMIGWVYASGFPKATRIKAEGYDGFRYGAQALKPALEPIYMGQKPFSEETGTANILKHGTGALNIDGCRIAAAPGDSDHPGDLTKRPMAANTFAAASRGDLKVTQAPPSALGRWPANLIHDGSDDVVAGFPETGVSSGGMGAASQRTALGGDVYGQYSGATLGGNAGGLGDKGSSARYFFSAKADADDRIGSKHPTVKPLDLIRYLTRLITPPGGTVLDCFAGTGTTGEAAFREGFNAILIEREAEYCADIRRRMALIMTGPDERKRAIVKERQRGKTVDLSGTLFAPPPTLAAE